MPVIRPPPFRLANVHAMILTWQKSLLLIASVGLVVTRASTLPDEFKLFARSGVVKEITGEVLAISKSLDLALIRTKPSGLAKSHESSAPVATEKLRVQVHNIQDSV